MNNSIKRNSKSVKDFLGNEYSCECIGCSIARKELHLPGGIIYEDDNIILGADPEIPIPGFLIITSKRHIRSFSELTKAERIKIADVLACAEKAIKEKGIANEITLVQEERSLHFHIWIFPEHEWMIDKFGKGIQFLRDISQYAKAVVDENVVDDILETVSIIREYMNVHISDY